MANKVKDAVVVITGGTGSFGSTMTKYLLNRNVQEIRVFSRDEAKQEAMRHEVSDSRVTFVIGDVRDSESVLRAVSGADLVFHAAAMKHVPAAENFPVESVRTNVLGSTNVLRACIEKSVESVVCLSTDKAVYPVNAMGMSKALMEKSAHSIARESKGQGTTISVTRYGNVLYSRGSVIPLFVSQIMAGRKLTITEPSMTRFLMTLDQSVELVEYAFEKANSGDLFVKKSPAATILDLSTAMLELFSVSTEQREILGFRQGEKLAESLLSAEESRRANDFGAFFRVPLEQDVYRQTKIESTASAVHAEEGYTSQNTEQLSVVEIKELLLTVPEIQSALRLFKN